MKFYSTKSLIVILNVLALIEPGRMTAPCFGASFPKVFQSNDSGTRAENHFEAITAHETLDAIFVGGTASQTDLVSAGSQALVARIDISSSSYVFMKLYSDSVNGLLFQVTALAVDPAGNKVAVHGSDTSQVIQNGNGQRLFHGSLYSYLFTIDTTNGEP